MTETALREVAREPGRTNEDLVKALESLLERARSGEVQGLAWTRVDADGSSGDGWSFSERHWDSRLLIFGLERLKLIILESYDRDES